MKGPVKLPKDHQAFMTVSPGTRFVCADCEYLGKDRKTCTEENFIAYNGSKFIPGDIERSCSDWYKPKKEQPRQRFEGVGHSEQEK